MRFLFTTSLYTTHKQPRRLRENSNIGENIYPNNAELLFDMAAQWNIESERIAERGGKLNISSTLIKLCCLRLERDSEITSSLLLRTTTIIKCFNKSFQRTRIAHEMMDVPEIKEGFFNSATVTSFRLLSSAFSILSNPCLATKEWMLICLWN